jgi:hypothetical protein
MPRNSPHISLSKGVVSNGIFPILLMFFPESWVSGIAHMHYSNPEIDLTWITKYILSAAYWRDCLAFFVGAIVTQTAGA